MDAAGEFFDDLAANCLDTAVSRWGRRAFPLGRCLKIKMPVKKRNEGKVVE